MIFPFSFWGADPFAGVVETLILSENFTGWFTAWNPIVETTNFSDDLNMFFDAIWNVVTETTEFSDNFNSGW